MAAQYKLEADGSVSITLNIKPHGSMLEQEEQIAAAVAEVGRLATELSLKGANSVRRSPESWIRPSPILKTICTG